jgi:hypothetical protein
MDESSFWLQIREVTDFPTTGFVYSPCVYNFQKTVEMNFRGPQISQDLVLPFVSVPEPAALPPILSNSSTMLFVENTRNLKCLILGTDDRYLIASSHSTLLGSIDPRAL